MRPTKIYTCTLNVKMATCKQRFVADGPEDDVSICGDGRAECEYRHRVTIMEDR